MDIFNEMKSTTFFVFTCLLYAVSCQNGTTAFQTDIWKFRPVRKEVNTSVIIHTKELNSLTSCLFFCFTRPEGEGVSLYYKDTEKTCHCNSQHDAAPDDNSSDAILYGAPFDAQAHGILAKICTGLILFDDTFDAQALFELNKNSCGPMQLNASEAMSDCLEFYEAAGGRIEDGVYPIVGWDGNTTPVYCDMANGGWTVVQRRFDGSVDFYRGWSDYRLGFGTVCGEYWIGLENLHHLTVPNSQLAVFVEAFPGVTPPSAYAQYDHVYIGDSTSMFTLNISGYINGTCGDSMTVTGRANGMPFSTFDMDNDAFLDTNCAIKYQGAWWYRSCHAANLNGHYYNHEEYDITNTGTYAAGIHWSSCWGYKHSHKSTLMKVRRKIT